MMLNTVPSRTKTNRKRTYRPLLQLCLLLTLAALLTGLPAPLHSQNNDRKRQIQSELKRLERDLSTATRMLSNTRKEKEGTLGELKLLQKQIKLREALLAKLKVRLVHLKEDIKNTEEMIATLEEDIAQIRKEYGRLAYATYKASSKKPKMFYLFSAKSLTEGYSRLRYFREFSRYQNAQLTLIKRTQIFLERKKIELNRQKLEETELLNTEKLESHKLLQAKAEKDELYKNLRKEEGKMQEQVKEKQKAIWALEKEMKKILEDEAKSLTKEDFDKLLPLTKLFNENKGRIPWPMPTSKGLITGHFGMNEDEDGIQENIPGVDIVTDVNQPIRAVFAGKVAKVQKIPYFGEVVVIRHGVKHFSVYTNLKNVVVQKGDEVEKLQRLGVAKTDKSTGETKIRFQLFENTDALNPEEWLVKKK